MRKGISTIIATIILVVITIGLVSTAYLYFSGLIAGATRGTIQLLDAYCVDASDDIFVTVQNKGTTNITSLTFLVDGQSATLGATCASINFGPDDSVTCNISNANEGMNEIRVVGPANSVGGTVQCK